MRHGESPLDLQPAEDRDANRAARAQLLEQYQRAAVPPLIERRIVDAGGRERWFRAARSALVDASGFRTVPSGPTTPSR